MKSMFHPFPVLETERLHLRPITQEDKYQIYALRTDLEVCKYLDRAIAKNIHEAIQHIIFITNTMAKNERVVWGMALKDDPKLIGAIGFWRIFPEDYRAEVGYEMLPEYQGKGLMSETMQAILKYGFEELKLHSVEAHLDPRNKRSIHLLEKNNFKLEAHFRERYFRKGEFSDGMIYTCHATEVKNI